MQPTPKAMLSRRVAFLGPVVAATAAVAAFAVVSAASAPAATVSNASLASSTKQTTVHAAKATGVGTVVVNSAGRTLYLFSPDKQKKVTCTGTCARYWPPLYVSGKPAAGAGIKASLLGTIKAPNGKTQVTYNHWPLYTFAGDSKAGQANGQGVVAFGGSWFALNVAGNRAMATPPPAATTTTIPYS
jgi:predicted lipoprotein with Yx(FWY)xxD motif